MSSRIKILLGFLLSTSLIIGQDLPGNQKLQVIDISSGYNTNKTLKLSDIAQSVEYIPLETKPDALISKVSQVALSNDHLFVLDEKVNKLFVFGRNGRYITTVGRFGKGPGEFQRLYHFEVNPDLNIIYLFDLGSHKILKYDYDGSYLGHTKQPLLGFWVSMINNKYFVYFYPDRSIKITKGFYKAIVTDLEGNIISKISEQPISKELKFKSPCSMQSSVFKLNNKAYYWEVTSDTIFFLSDDFKLIPSAVVNQGPNTFPKDKMYDGSFVIKKFSEYSTIIWMLQTNELLFGQGITRFRLASILYNKKTQACYNVANNMKLIENDFDYGPGFWPLGKFDDNTLYTSIDVIDIRDKLYHQDIKEGLRAKSRLTNLIRNKKELDNPIIMIVKLKDEK